GGKRVEYVTVLDDVGCGFAAEGSVLLRFRHAAGSNQIVVADDLSADEPALNIAVNFPSSINSGHTPPDRPGSALVRPNSKERHQSQKLERKADNTVPA